MINNSGDGFKPVDCLSQSGLVVAIFSLIYRFHVYYRDKPGPGPVHRYCKILLRMLCGSRIYVLYEVIGEVYVN